MFFTSSAFSYDLVLASSVLYAIISSLVLSFCIVSAPIVQFLHHVWSHLKIKRFIIKISNFKHKCRLELVDCGSPHDVCGKVAGGDN